MQQLAFIVPTKIQFNGCQVCLAAPVRPPASMSALFENWFRRKVLRSSVPNMYDIMGGLEMFRPKIERGERILNVKAQGPVEAAQKEIPQDDV
jgi:hypothetical protein